MEQFTFWHNGFQQSTQVLCQLVHATCLDFVQFILSDAFTVLTLSLIAY